MTVYGLFMRVVLAIIIATMGIFSTFAAVEEEQGKKTERVKSVTAVEEVLTTSEVVSSERIPDTEAVVTASEQKKWVGKLPLSAFSQEKVERFLQLKQAEASYELHVPVPHRTEPENIKVHLVFTNSIALLSGRSQIRLIWNGQPVAQAALDPEFPDGEMDVSVPLDIIKGGSNKLSLEVSQHYLAECEDPGSPELWTTVDMESSYIQLSGVLKRTPSHLTELDQWLSYALWGELKLTVASLGASDAHLHAGTTIAQGMGAKTSNPMLIDARPLLSSLASLPDGQDAVIFGLYEEAMAIPGLLTSKPSFLGRVTLMPQERDNSHFILLILADAPDNLIKVTNALAWSKLPLQATSTVDIKEIIPPEASPYAAKKATMGDRTYSFSDLDFKTTQLKGLHDHARIEMWLPPDLFAKNHSTVDLSLHFSYGAALRGDSVMNIYHNGMFLQSLSLGDPNGLQVNDYRVMIPMHAFRPGLNEFVFESRMHANTGSNCTTGNTDNLLMTLYEDSTISIPDAPHFAAMPNLNYTINTGYPYLGNNKGEPVIQVKEVNNNTLSTAWTLASKIGQLKGAPVQSLTVTTDVSGHADVIRLANLKDITQSLWQHTPVDLSEAGLINHPSLKDPTKLGSKTTSKLEELYRLFWWNDRETQGESFYGSRIRHTVQVIENSGIMMQLENPEYDSGTLTLILADGDIQLKRSVADLIRLWPELLNAQGDILFWGENADQRLSYNALDIDTHRYHIGNISWWKKITYYAIQYPIFLLGVMLVLLLSVTWITREVLKAHRKIHHPDVK